MSERSKIDYLENKPEIYYWGSEEKELTIEAKTHAEFKELAKKVQDIWDESSGIDLKDEKLLDVLSEKPVELINDIVKENFTQEDFDNGYPNDLYNLYQAFKAVNFTFLTRLTMGGSRIMGIISQLTNQLKKQN